MLFDIISGNALFIEVVTYILSSLIVVLLTLPVHEYAHGFVAYKLGDPTPKYQGRLTLNPLAHIDYLGAASILLFGFGWAKPVQVDARYFKKPKRDMAIVALAGPLSNIIIALISTILLNILFVTTFLPTEIFYILQYIFIYVAQINVYLAVFNLIPIPPLDGSRLISAFLPNKFYYSLMHYERYLFYIVLALVWVGVLDNPIYYLSNLILNGLDFIASLPFAFI